MSRTRNHLCAIGCVGLLGVGALIALDVVAAKPAPAMTPRTDPETTRRLERLRLQLAAQDPATILAAFEAIASEKLEAAAPLIRDFIRRGASAELIASAVQTTGKLKLKDLASVIAPLISHRDKEVRKRTVDALVQLGGPDAVQALRRGLRGPDPAVRGAAASGLGDLGAKAALPDLFQAFARNVGEAATSIGLVCDPDSCRKFAATLGSAPFDLVTSGFDQMFFRPPAELPDEVKIEVLQKLAALQTNEVSRYLAELRKRSPEEWTPKLKKALDRAIKETGGN
jgi:hypothetical protein